MSCNWESSFHSRSWEAAGKKYWVSFRPVAIFYYFDSRRWCWFFYGDLKVVQTRCCTFHRAPSNRRKIIWKWSYEKSPRNNLNLAENWKLIANVEIMFMLTRQSSLTFLSVPDFVSLINWMIFHIRNRFSLASGAWAPFISFLPCFSMLLCAMRKLLIHNWLSEKEKYVSIVMSINPFYAGNESVVGVVSGRRRN